MLLNGRHLIQPLHFDPINLNPSKTIMGLSTQDLISASDAEWESGFKDQFASTRPQSESEPDPSSVLCCVTVREKRNARSLRAVWNSRVTTLNPDQGSVSSEFVFSARVESPHI